MSFCCLTSAVMREAGCQNMYIASSSSVVKFHEFPDNHLAHTYQPSSKVEGPCRSLSWTKNGYWLAVVPYSGCVEIVSLKGQCKLIHSVYDISEPTCASFQNLTKRHLAVGTKHGQVLLYDVKARIVKARYPRTTSAITHVGFTAKDTHCYAGCVNGEVLLFNHQFAKTLSCILKVPKSRSLTAIKAHVQRKNFITAGSSEGIVCVWDVNVNKVKFQNEAHNAPVSSTIFSPVNSSLIVSAGLDRVVRVFDIESQSRISTITVENNVLCLGFLEDSLYVAMGCQNGKIQIYDTRAFQDPLYTFEAHKGAVRHLSYQCSCTEAVSNNSSLGSMGSDPVTTRKSVSNEEVQANKKSISDFFGLVAQGPSSVSEVFEDKKTSKTASMEAGDSFLLALGISKESQKEQLLDSVKEQQDEVDQPLPAQPKILLSKSQKSVSAFTPKLMDDRNLLASKPCLKGTSTPKLPQEGLFKNLSPIVSGSQQISINAEVQTAIRDDIQAEVKKSLEEMESKFSYLVMSHAHQIRRMILDLHMANLNEFIKMEDNINLIRDEIASEPPSARESHLLEENVSLKMRVLELERQLGCLSAISHPERGVTSEENHNVQ